MTLASRCRAIRVSRSVANSPNFHSIHHGFGATSYQNVQIENYGSIPVPSEDHYHNHVQEEGPIIYIIEGTNEDEHEDDTPGIYSIPVIDQRQHVDQLIVVERGQDHELPFIADDYEDVRHFTTLDEFPQVNSDIRHSEFHDVPDYSFFHTSLGKDQPKFFIRNTL